MIPLADEFGLDTDRQAVAPTRLFRLIPDIVFDRPACILLSWQLSFKCMHFRPGIDIKQGRKICLNEISQN